MNLPLQQQGQMPQQPQQPQQPQIPPQLALLMQIMQALQLRQNNPSMLAYRPLNQMQVVNPKVAQVYNPKQEAISSAFNPTKTDLTNDKILGALQTTGSVKMPSFAVGPAANNWYQ